MNTENHYQETDLGNISLNPRGEYNPEESYEYLDLVVLEGGSYVCLAENGTTITGISPESGKTTQYWQVITIPGSLTPEYIAMHDRVVNLSEQVGADAVEVRTAEQNVSGMELNVTQMQEQTRQSAEAAEQSKDSSAGYAASADASRQAAEESKQNIDVQVTGFDSHVAEKTEEAENDIEAARIAANKAIIAQQEQSVNEVARAGIEAISTTQSAAQTATEKAQAAATSERNAAASETAAKLSEENATKMAEQVATDKEQVAYDRTAVENAKQEMTGSVAQIERNTQGISELKGDKIDKPSSADNGKIPRAKEGEVEWTEVGQPTDEQTNSAVSSWLDEHPEATTTVRDGSIEEIKINKNFLPWIKKDYVTPEMFGAKGDGISDDTEAIQKCLDNENRYKFLSGKYKINSSIIVNGNKKNIQATTSIINYTGNDSAVIIKGCTDSDIHFGSIYARSGNGIKLECHSENDALQYVNIHFLSITSLNNCILFDTNSGWINEIRIFDGKLDSGSYGIYADAHDRNSINNITIQNVGIEGVDTGFYLANNVNSWNIVNCRYHESYTYLFKTSGIVKNINFFGSGYFYYDKACIFSSETNMKIISPIVSNGGSILDLSGRIVKGCIVFDNYPNYINTLKQENLNINHSNTTSFILVGENLKTIKLNSAYGTNYGINELYIRTHINNITIYNSNDEIITSALQPSKTYKLKYFDSIKWIIEEI